VFLDIGANYGLHSVLFLAHGVEAITFEPNPSCHEGFREICDRNGLTGRIEGVAIGDQPGEVDLVYPERETWLGTIHSGRPSESNGAPDVGDGLHVQRVPLKALDDYVGELDGRRVLMKIDTEGSEYGVLSGGSETLETVRPLIIFESFADADADRRRMHELLEARGYGIASLPWRSELPSPVLDEAAFIVSRAENFIATPLG
jgi:FkbM family methyltransferase